MAFRCAIVRHGQVPSNVRTTSGFGERQVQDRKTRAVVFGSVLDKPLVLSFGSLATRAHQSPYALAHRHTDSFPASISVIARSHGCYAQTQH